MRYPILARSVEAGNPEFQGKSGNNSLLLFACYRRNAGRAMFKAPLAAGHWFDALTVL